MEAPAGVEAAMAPSTGAWEHHRVLQMPDGAGQGRQVAVVGTPEKPLNCFVRSVAVIERVGNALGTLAFTWATVVLLGGCPTVLRAVHDFWFATTIVFLEAARYAAVTNFILPRSIYTIALPIDLLRQL